MQITITLPWYNYDLSPNGRLHHYAKAKLIKLARRDAELLVRSMNPPKLTPPLFRHVEIYPPDKRRCDADNITGSLKATFDGIADALGLDDRLSSVTSGSWHVGPITPGGKIEVTIGEDHNGS